MKGSKNIFTPGTQMQINALPNKQAAGQSLVEMALVLLIILLLLVGIVDLGRVLFYYQSMRDAVQEAAAYGSAFPQTVSEGVYLANCQAIQERVVDNVPDITTADVAVTIDGRSCIAGSAAVIKAACSGRPIVVTAVKNGFPLIMPLIGQFVGQAITLSATTTATILTPMCPQ